MFGEASSPRPEVPIEEDLTLLLRHVGGASSVLRMSNAVRPAGPRFTVTGATDGTPADIDPATGSATLLAADRARAVAVLLAPLVGSTRLRLLTDPLPRGRTATATLAFVGERPPRSSR